MVTLNEDFKPDGKYTGYLLLATLALIVVIWAACCAWMFVDSIFTILIVIGLAVLGVCVVFACIWAPLYYKSVFYHLNDTEMTWKRGVFFRKTGIVPYNRITNVDIVQGPVMRLFGISHLKIETAGGGASKSSAEIQLEGISDPEPLRQLIMDFVRGQKPAAAATGTEYKSQNADLQALLEEVTAIRRLLEERK
ncbi:PH domain-containing protein [Methanocorpusculum sp.]|nr:PH domain-containing protein [Methanocorpusculum sp.]MBO5367665.1 PH domain-containing protein [Methanocorpusculum sp.]MBP3444225.1 PH domain-containing protein [Methanocorpusculaceae archaeon]